MSRTCSACGQSVKESEARKGYEIVQELGVIEYFHPECLEKVLERRNKEPVLVWKSELDL